MNAADVPNVIGPSSGELKGAPTKVEYHRKSVHLPLISTELSGIPWISVEFDRFLWDSINFHGCLWMSLEVLGGPCVHIFQVSFHLLQTLPLSFQASICSASCLPNLETWCRAMGDLKPCSRLWSVLRVH